MNDDSSKSSSSDDDRRCDSCGLPKRDHVPVYGGYACPADRPFEYRVDFSRL